MKNYYKIGAEISSRMRSRGYAITYTQRWTTLIFYLNDEFLFAIDTDLISEAECEKMLIEVIKEKNDVSIRSKN